MKEMILILIGSALVNNVVLSQFLGLCPFLGVSKKTKTAASMGAAVIFVIMIASAVTYAVHYMVLVPLGMEYMQTIVFILVIAALVQIKPSLALSSPLNLPAPGRRQLLYFILRFSRNLCFW